MASVDDLTPELLTDLYSVQLLSEKEIAARFGVNQVRINRLRKKWGIPTLQRSDRLQLPPLTDLQVQVLRGSLLGDGSISAVGLTTARFTEGHSPKQEAYLRWKAALFAPFTAKVFPTTDGISFYTHSCQELRPFYDQWYPHGVRVFPPGLRAMMTPLVLAVWFMDDGSLSNRFHPRITFGLDDLSLRRAIHALRGMDLHPQVHPNDKDGCQSIEFPGYSDRFFELVTPHIPEGMRYKVPESSERRDVDRNARELTSKQAASMYEAGMSLDEIARLHEVGRSTVVRRLQAAGQPRRKMGRPRREFTAMGAEVALGNFTPEKWKDLLPEDQDQWVQDILGILRAIPFPYPQLPSVEKVTREFDRLRMTPMALRDGVVEPWSPMGIRLCNPFFPNRYRAVSKGVRSAFEVWYDDVKLSKAIRFQLDHGDPVLPGRVLRAVTMTCRTPSVFKPTTARFIYETLCPKGGKVWDPCAGYGGRLLGAMAAGVEYLGTDVEPDTVEGNRRLHAEVVPDGKAELVLERAELFDPGPVDLVFTSPPYFDRERYSGSQDQSWVQHGSSLDAWLGGFLGPVVRTAFKSLPLGGRFVLNVADLNERKETLPVVARTIDLALAAGFNHEVTWQMPLSRLNRQRPSEPVLVFRR